jgi:hypothetical protein
MENAERIGMTVSAAGHGGLILLALIGGIFSHDDDNQAVVATEVSLISSDQFAALQAAAPTAPTESPEALAAPEETAAAEAPETVAEAAPETAPPTPAEPDPEPAPDVSEDLPPSPQPAPEAPPLVTPPVEVPSDTVLEEVAPTPRPTDADIVAPQPEEAPDVIEEAPDEIEAVTETPTEELAPDAPTEEAAAPDETTTQTPIENEVAEVTQSSAPLSSPRPPGRPERPAPAPEPDVPADVAEAPAEETAPEVNTEAAVEDALAEALGGAQANEPTAGSGTSSDGPPLTSGEKDALVVAVKKCWNVGALSSDALRVTVTVRVAMSPDGRPDSGSISMDAAEGGDDTAVRQAFETARRAIINCGRNGFPLPPEKFETWQTTVIVFNPERMRMR